MSNFVIRKVKGIKPKKKVTVILESKGFGKKSREFFLFLSPLYVSYSPINRAFGFSFSSRQNLRAQVETKKKKENTVEILREFREKNFGEK